MSKGYKKFLVLWLGTLISTIGSGITSFGLGVYVFKMTGSASNMALVTFCGFLPGIILKVFSGALADKFDRRLMMILGDGLSGLGILFILIMLLNNVSNLWGVYVGVIISSVFSSLTEPAFNATITDLVNKDEYTKASGMVSIAGSSRFLISPVLAGFLLAIWDIKALLIIDIMTFAITVFATFYVRKGLGNTKVENNENLKAFLKDGFKVVWNNKGILVLVILASFINFFMGFIQVLSESLVLGFTTEKVLGVCESVCASGMLVSSIIIGVLGIKKHHRLMLILSLVFSGSSMIGFGLFDNIYLISIFGFLFFLGLPIANTALDSLVRLNIPNEIQGRAWGVIGLISQIGSGLSFALSGILADLMAKNYDISVGRASGYIISIGGLLLTIIAISTILFKSVKELEKSIPGTLNLKEA